MDGGECFTMPQILPVTQSLHALSVLGAVIIKQKCVMLHTESHLHDTIVVGELVLKLVVVLGNKPHETSITRSWVIHRFFLGGIHLGQHGTQNSQQLHKRILGNLISNVLVTKSMQKTARSLVCLVVSSQMPWRP